MKVYYKYITSDLLGCYTASFSLYSTFLSFIHSTNITEHRRRQWHPTPVLLPGKSHGWRSLVGCSPWGRSELDMTEWLHFDFSLSCIGVGNGNPLQCSYLENPMDRGAWWAAVYEVAQSRTWLKRLSSSSSIVQGAGDTTVAKTNKVSILTKLLVSREREINR